MHNNIAALFNSDIIWFTLKKSKWIILGCSMTKIIDKIQLDYMTYRI